jgi:hypothetical protein
LVPILTPIFRADCELAFVGAINYFLEHDIYYDEKGFNAEEFNAAQNFNDMAFYTQMKVNASSLTTDGNGEQASPPL